MNIRDLTIAFLIFILAGLFAVLGSIGIEQEYVPKPCVDGAGDVNLEGIMCNKPQISFFGIEDKQSVAILFLIWFLTSMAIFILSIVYFLNSWVYDND